MICPACKTDNLEGAEECKHCGQDLHDLSRPKAHSAVEKSLHVNKVTELGSRQVIVVDENRKVRDVIASLVLRRQGCAVVVDKEGKLIGVFTERDLLMKIAGEPDELLDHPISEFMVRNPTSIESSAPIAYAMHQMDVGGYRHVPVVNDGVPVSMISARDLIRFIDERFLS